MDEVIYCKEAEYDVVEALTLNDAVILPNVAA